MTSISKIILNLFLLLVLWGFQSPVASAESLSLSVSPTLFDMSANPGQEWRSSLKVINTNKFELTLYAEVVDFRPDLPGGGINYLENKIIEDATSATLAEWIFLETEKITIPAGKTVDIPFIIKVPEKAEPGGHYAAILVGTRPTAKFGGSGVQTSQIVTSLIFTRVAGEVKEVGTIQSFTTNARVLEKPEAEFKLLFENKGNVHLVPQGEIKITNLWGEERGVIPINQNSSLTRVLPKSEDFDGVGRYLFSWKGEWSVADIGRYKAVASLAFGSENQQTTTKTIYFWVVPIKLVSVIFLFIVLSGWLLTWLIKLYIKRVIALSGLEYEDQPLDLTKTIKAKLDFKAPLAFGVLDLKTKIKNATKPTSKLKEISNFFWEYRLFFGGVVMVVVIVSSVVWFIFNANTKNRGFEVTLPKNGAETVKLSAEDIAYERLKSARSLTQEIAKDQLKPIVIVNRSGKTGLGAEVRLKLEEKGFMVSDLTANFASPQVRTTILFSEDQEMIARDLSEILGNAFLIPTTVAGEIIIFVGSDLAKN